MPVSARSRISRIALAWRSESWKRSISAARAPAVSSRGADQPDRLVEVVEDDREAFEDVGARLGLLQVVGGAADHDFAAELEEVPQHVLQRQRLGAAVHQREHVHAEGALQRRLLVELVQRDVGRRVALQLDHDAHALAVRLVAQIRDALDAALAHVIGDALEQRRLVQQERDLGDDDAAAALGLLDARRDRAR